MPTLPFNGYYLTLALLAACTIFGIVVAAQFRREVDEDLAPTTAKDLLDPLEKAYYSGLMHPAEIEKIRESVRKQQPAQATSEVKPTATRTASPDPGHADDLTGEHLPSDPDQLSDSPSDPA